MFHNDDTLSSIPLEILFIINRYLETEQVANLATINKQMYHDQISYLRREKQLKIERKIKLTQTLNIIRDDVKKYVNTRECFFSSLYYYYDDNNKSQTSYFTTAVRDGKSPEFLVELLNQYLSNNAHNYKVESLFKLKTREIYDTTPIHLKKRIIRNNTRLIKYILSNATLEDKDFHILYEYGVKVSKSNDCLFEKKDIISYLEKYI